MRNQHLIPANIVDIVDRINNELTNQNERMILIQRLEAIKEYVENNYSKISNNYLKNKKS